MSSGPTATLLPAPSPSSSPSSSRLMSAGSRSSNASNVSLQPRPPTSKVAPALSPAPTSLSAQSPPKRSAPALQPAPIAASKSTAPTISSKGPAATPIAAVKKDGGPVVQPSKEWVLPARAKPGRKPSETEPLTKRKAQNRASQRAFRERKQSYLQDLEAKVAAYEAAEIDRSVEIQKLAQKLRAENEVLRKELLSWKERASQLEIILNQARASGKLPNVVPSSKSGPGCKAPAHEKSTPKRGVLVGPGSKGKEKGEVRFVDSVDSKSAIALPIKIKPSTQVESGPASPAKGATDSVASPTSGKVQIDATPVTPTKASKPALWSIQPTVDKASTSSAAHKSESLLSPPLMPSQNLHVEGGCGFCTEASPCVCADDFIDLDGGSSTPPAAGPSHIPITSDVPAAVPLPKRPSPPVPQPPAASRMRIDSITNAVDPVQDKKPKKLWYTVNQEPRAKVTVSQTVNAPGDAQSVSLSLKPRTSTKKLWFTTEAKPRPVKTPVASNEPVCTGDPSTCGACSTDPGLAAFCEAVTTAATTTPPPDTPSAAVFPAGPGASARPVMMRSGTTGHLPSISSSSHLSPPSASSMQLGGETIPSAWRQIRSHPRFSSWQGGLDLLAEVVSRRSGNVHSPMLGHRKPSIAASDRPRQGSVEIETPRSAQSLSATSSDRATAVPLPSRSDKPMLLHTASETSIHDSAPRIKRELDGEADTVQTHANYKRRRILVDREAVQEALKLLDGGTAAQPRSLLRRTAEEEALDAAGPCPCPWRPGDRRPE
ncbi:hypothetical protein BCV70DRAFT_202700 [Testicularia cyperi]|uniref:BZIP domain-containing protein n=1 Tax=Testicularia cyperi TaxID=1882483 RepID=A0A317XIJ2_9BASI|nr:hypothetical protein BCV70DRAFT_202700 [Testicularia cyperi]